MFDGPLMLQLSERLRKEIASRFANPAQRSQDGTAVMVRGGPGFGAFISPEGDAFLETYELDNVDKVTLDRSREAVLQVLVLGSNSLPELASLLPARPEEAANCAKCVAGWVAIGSARVICEACSGLGWVQEHSS